MSQSKFAVGDLIRAKNSDFKGRIVGISDYNGKNILEVEINRHQWGYISEDNCELDTPLMATTVRVYGVAGGGAGSGAALITAKTKFNVGEQVEHQTYKSWGRGTIDDDLGNDEYRVKYDFGGGAPSYVVCDADDITRVTKAPWSINYSDLNRYDTHVANSWVSDDQRKKWKEEGKCQECGKLLPMSIHGLLECPDHPKPLPEGYKQ